jgi:glycosyltransferase involved in cell wall biosynthesis
MARVAFYDPFLDILGGGEKVLLTIVEEVARTGAHEVVVMSPHRPDLDLWRRLNVSVDPRHLRWRAANPLSATPLSAGIDLFVTLVNHFPPLSLARRSAAIIQFPFARLTVGPRLLGAVRAGERGLRVRSYDQVICYSRFVADEIRARLHVADPLVIAPPVDLPRGVEAVAKERKVIAVGRFFPASDANNKKHNVLIDAWRELGADRDADGWELHLVGGMHSDPASVAYVEELRRRAAGAAIHFHVNASAECLVDLYRRSALFWHATGFGETQAERHEHFGITTVEAMAYGCAPVVVRLGGQLEIVQDGMTGRVWGSIPELVSITRELMADPQRTAEIGKAAAASAARFGKDTFVRAVRAQILEPAGVHVG